MAHKLDVYGSEVHQMTTVWREGIVKKAASDTVKRGGVRRSGRGCRPYRATCGGTEQGTQRASKPMQRPRGPWHMGAREAPGLWDDAAVWSSGHPHAGPWEAKDH